MSIFSNLAAKLKDTSAAVGSLFAIIASIGGAILYVENNYANAADVKELLRNQNSQIEIMRQAQRENRVFQLEYYDNTIKKLETERNRSEQLLSDPKTTNAQRAYTRNPADIQREINDLNMRKEIIKRGIIESK